MEHEITQTNVLALPFAGKKNPWHLFCKGWQKHPGINFLILALSLMLSLAVLVVARLGTRPMYEAQSLIHVGPGQITRIDTLITALTRADLVELLISHPQTQKILADEAKFYPGQPIHLTSAAIRRNLRLIPTENPGEIALAYRSPNPHLAAFLATQLPLLLENLAATTSGPKFKATQTFSEMQNQVSSLPVTYSDPTLYRMLLTSLEDNKLSLAASPIPIHFVSPAQIPATALPGFTPALLGGTLLSGFLGGMLLMWFASVTLSRTDTLAIQLEKLSGLPVLGVVPATMES